MQFFLFLSHFSKRRLRFRERLLFFRRGPPALGFAQLLRPHRRREQPVQLASSGLSRRESVTFLHEKITVAARLS